MTLTLADPTITLKPHLQAKTSDILTSPDVQLLKLASPELERLIIQSSNGLITTTPTPTQFLCPRNVTDEQEGFAEGFVRALAELHHQHVLPNAPGVPVTSAGQTRINNSTTLPPVCSVAGALFITNVTMRSESPVYEDFEHFHPGCHHQLSPGLYHLSACYELPVCPASAPHLWAAVSPTPQAHSPERGAQTVPEMLGETPPLSPIDMENQERIKAERKRMRNRVAASKCRKRKLERISRLEDKVKNLKTQNSDLASTANMLREQVAQLKQK
ncbi:hypothetical protein J4Q44_G00154860 [Coregonus suidteri]|uniref:Transcription factor Jun n=1 Tax=Coregonus suidteri TaxID=861788 RepID=A0AAN8LLK0_9TELE